MGLLDIVKSCNNNLVTKEDKVLNINTLTLINRVKSQEKYSFINLVQETIKSHKITAKEAVDFVASNFSRSFPTLVTGGKKGASQLTYNNYRNWRGDIRFAKDNEDALRLLADKYVSGVRGKEQRDNNPFWKTFFAMYMNENKLPVNVAYKRAIAKCRKDYPHIEIPTINQVVYRTSQIPPKEIILARYGEVAFKNKCMDFIQRDWDDIIAGELIIADSRDFDTRVKVWDDEKQKWIAVRPTIAGFMDARSWFTTSYWITTEPVNHKTLIDVLALHLVNTNGVPPNICYFDNGKDYCAKGFSNPCEGHSIFQELGIKLVNAIPFQARSKTIERCFRDTMQNFDKMFPDYLGSRVGQRTLAASYYDKRPEELPSMQEFCSLFHDWICEYHNTPKQGKIHEGKTPFEIWNSRPQKVGFSGERLFYALLKPEAIRQVGRGPSVTLNKEFYYCDRLNFGDKVLVKTDRLDNSHVYCYTLKGELIGEALTRSRVKAMALDDEASRKQIGELLARQRRQIKEAKTMVAQKTGGYHQLSPMELFLAEGLPELKLIGTTKSVKGTAHNFHKMAPVSNVELPPCKTEQIEEFIEKSEPKDDFKTMDLQDIHSFMVNKNKNKGDDLL